MIKETELFGTRDKIAIAIQRIKEFEPMAIQNNPAGYHVCISGGKDSSVIQELCIMAEVKCEFVHSHTSVDFPETVYFVRKEKERLERMGYIFRIDIPRWRDGRQRTMWNSIPTKGLPLRIQRWCCEKLKETSGHDRYCITGVRWAESTRRAKERATHEIMGRSKHDNVVFNNDNEMKRKLTEFCLLKQRFVLNPIIDWMDADIWHFLEENNLPYNPLYDRGYRRIGCIGCPMSSNRKKELDDNPKYKASYYRAAEKYIERRQPPQDGKPKQTPEEYFEWWLTGKRKEDV